MDHMCTPSTPLGMVWCTHGWGGPPWWPSVGPCGGDTIPHNPSVGSWGWCAGGLAGAPNPSIWGDIMTSTLRWWSEIMISEVSGDVIPSDGPQDGHHGGPYVHTPPPLWGGVVYPWMGWSPMVPLVGPMHGAPHPPHTLGGVMGMVYRWSHRSSQPLNMGSHLTHHPEMVC